MLSLNARAQYTPRKRRGVECVRVQHGFIYGDAIRLSSG